MTNITNPQPRFGLNADGTLYCYRTNESLAATGTVEDADGTWDLAKVAAAIASGQSVEVAYTSSTKGGSARFSELADEAQQLRRVNSALGNERDKLNVALDAANSTLSFSIKTIAEQNEKLYQADRELDKLKMEADILRVGTGQPLSELNPESLEEVVIEVKDKVETANADFVANTPPAPEVDKVEAFVAGESKSEGIEE